MLITGLGRITLAPGVSFDEESHEYRLGGIRLSGVTGKISGRLGLRYDEAGDMLGDKCDEGSNIHKWVQEWIDTGKMRTVHPGAVWVRNALETRYLGSIVGVARSEVLVSDLQDYASAVDIMVEHDGAYDIYDIKTGKFNPEYLAWQLGCYRWFMTLRGLTVRRCMCLCVRDRMAYNVRPRGAEDVRALLYGGKYGD